MQLFKRHALFCQKHSEFNIQNFLFYIIIISPPIFTFCQKHKGFTKQMRKRLIQCKKSLRIMWAENKVFIISYNHGFRLHRLHSFDFAQYLLLIQQLWHVWCVFNHSAFISKMKKKWSRFNDIRLQQHTGYKMGWQMTNDSMTMKVENKKSTETSANNQCTEVSVPNLVLIKWMNTIMKCCQVKWNFVECLLKNEHERRKQM